MESRRSGSKPVVTESNAKASSAPESEKSGSTTKKRKAEDATLVNDNKENVSPTPVSKSREISSTEKKRKAEDGKPIDVEKESDNSGSPIQQPNPETTEGSGDEREKTPGRDGPIKEDQMSLEPDIKPFKGEPGHKVRKTAREKEEEYRQFALKNEGHTFHELHVCFEKGPNGSPTYDKAGFQLDFDKVADWFKPQAYNKSRIVNGMSRAVENRQKETKRMAELFFEKGEAPTDSSDLCIQAVYWRDRVSKDLNVPWHKTGVKEFEEWDRRGFRKARRGEYGNPSEAERKRMLRMMTGASLRK